MCIRCSYGNETTDKCGCVSDPKCFLFTFVFSFSMLLSGIILMATVPEHVCPDGYHGHTCYVYTEKFHSNGMPYTKTDSLRCTSEALPVTCKNQSWPNKSAKDQNTFGLLLLFGCVLGFLVSGILICLHHGFDERQQIRLSHIRAVYSTNEMPLPTETVLTDDKQSPRTMMDLDVPHFSSSI